ncbi:WD40 repeat domain-containing protein [Actinoallomurus soli]|uniref:WD40 repeat domain-containing protein n=1 Tax=Actinoallomurus soli TaxID=2952535 RepID=UPI0020934BD2|nr:PQQ-binding-like beta-propeller repeat protein [Actinoallomurus soli]MCO5968240.1 PQQ-binding-like beta-propeller repeat protein [Actinoallomurus soli]
MLLTLSPRGRLLLVASLRDDTIACWEVESGAELWRVPDDSYSFSLTAVCLPEGRMLVASGGEDGVCRWDALTGEALPGHLCPGTNVWSVASGTVPDGRSILVAAGQDQVDRWDVVTGEPVGAPLRGHGISVKSIDVIALPDGSTMIASGGEDAAIRRWDAVSGAPLGTPLDDHEGQVSELASAALPDGRILLAGADSDGVIRGWDAITGEPIGHPTPTGSSVHDLIAITAAEGRPCLLAAGEDKVIRRIDPLTGGLIGDPIPGLAVAAAYDLDGTAMIAISTYSGDVTVRPLR